MTTTAERRVADAASNYLAGRGSGIRATNMGGLPLLLIKLREYLEVWGRRHDAPDTVADTLHDRESRYGHFPEQARVTQNIKQVMADSENWGQISDDKRLALEMIALKIGRILNGDPEYADSWHDVAGFATLVERAILADAERGRNQ